MHSGYGGVSEMQEFLVDGYCAPTLFSISSPPWPPPPPSYPAATSELHPQSQPSLDLQLPYFHPIPITQQQTHHNHQQFQPFQQSSTPTPLMTGRLMGSPYNFMAADDSGGGGEEDGSESRFHHPWQRESSIKKPFWRPLDINYINPNNNNSCNNKEPESSTIAYNKKSKEVMSDNYKLFNELDAIYNKPGRVPNNEAGSGSALTGDDTPLLDRSPDEAVEAPPVEILVKMKGRRKRKRRNHHQQQQQQQLSLSIAGFFEGLVNQLMEHQRKFLDAIERRDQDRMDRVEASRKHEAARTAREAAARDRERALAAARESAIVEFVEKLIGQQLDLPPHGNDETTTTVVPMNGGRWPRAEVQSLIRVRSGVELRFREPGLKGLLWEEVSSAMGGLGYQRSATRCKEKWENINKYFRKAKGSGGKKRTEQSKTCAYFHQLDQLYACSSKQWQPLPPPPMMGDSSTQLLNPATD